MSIQEVKSSFSRLQENKEEILKKWLIETRSLERASAHHGRPLLLNSLPLFVDQIVEALQAHQEFSYASISNPLSASHGIQRASIGHYTLDEVISEYAILEKIIVEVLRNTGELKEDEVFIISCLFLNAIRSASCSFVRTLNDLHEESEILFSRLVNDAKDLAICILSPEGEIQSWNEGAKKIKQFAEAEVVGKHFRLLYTEQDQLSGRPERNLKIALEKGRFEEQWWRVRKDGSLWWADVIIRPIYASNGKHLGFSKIVRDMTEKKRIEDALVQAKKVADAATKQKSHFVANMSHEIRTPLTAILGFSNVLRDPELSQHERDNIFEIIDRNGKVLLRLIDDILDFSKIEAGKLDLNPTEVIIRQLLSQIAEPLQRKAEIKGLSFRLKIDDDIPPSIGTDPIRLRQIVGNIVGNSIKFTESGFVEVWVHQDKNLFPRILEIDVSDTGPGIPREKRDGLFEEFAQADQSITRKYGGSGLGLALSRNLARELGGDIQILDSDSGTGVLFRIRIANWDLTHDKKENGTVKGRFDEMKNFEKRYSVLKGRRVLVIDDSPDNQKLIELLLQRWGLVVESAQSGRSGIEKAMHSPYDIVLMDTQMPDLEGHEATRELRRLGYAKPIVAFTAHAMAHEKVKALQAGCDDHLSKPVDAEQLLRILEKWTTAH